MASTSFPVPPARTDLTTTLQTLYAVPSNTGTTCRGMVVIIHNYHATDTKYYSLHNVPPAGAAAAANGIRYQVTLAPKATAEINVDDMVAGALLRVICEANTTMSAATRGGTVFIP